MGGLPRGLRNALHGGAPLSASLQAADQGAVLRLEAGGGWTVAALQELDRRWQSLRAQLAPSTRRVTIGMAGLEQLDTAGAWLLHRLERELGERGLEVGFEQVKSEHGALLDEVRRVHAEPTPLPPRPTPVLRVIAELGQGTLEALEEGRQLLSFYGQIMISGGRLLLHPGRFRLTSMTFHLEQTGVNALPIVGLISFLIGIVLAYQGADQLRYFGAEIFTIDLLGVSVLREIGILLTAIVVAGRSGSAFTAQLGTMQVTEEIDALRTMGLDPIEVLVLPRMVALMIALPLLAFFADIMALFGGGLMCVFVLDIPPAQFLSRLDYAVVPSMFWVGIIKAPVFAFLIGMVGCYEGMNTRGSAENIGIQTTRAVVVGIFLVIVFDALFSILFSYLGF